MVEGLLLIVGGIALIAIGIVLAVLAIGIARIQRTLARPPTTEIEPEPRIVPPRKLNAKVEAPEFSHVWRDAPHMLGRTDRAAWEEAQRAVDGRE